MSTLEIKDLHVSITGEDGSEKEILKGVNLTVKSGGDPRGDGPPQRFGKVHAVVFDCGPSQVPRHLGVDHPRR